MKIVWFEPRFLTYEAVARFDRLFRSDLIKKIIAIQHNWLKILRRKN
jgi:hypothetical protein